MPALEAQGERTKATANRRRDRLANAILVIHHVSQDRQRSSDQEDDQREIGDRHRVDVLSKHVVLGLSCRLKRLLRHILNQIADEGYRDTQL